MPRTSELPADIDAEELNELIAALAREHDIPNWVYGPDLVELDHIPQYIFGYNRGGVHDGLEMYKAGQKWRRRLIKELSQRPEFIEEFRADKRLDECIRELCEAKGLTFYPWEVPPWQAPDELPEDY